MDGNARQNPFRPVTDTQRSSSSSLLSRFGISPHKNNVKQLRHAQTAVQAHPQASSRQSPLSTIHDPAISAQDDPALVELADGNSPQVHPITFEKEESSPKASVVPEDDVDTGSMQTLRAPLNVLENSSTNEDMPQIPKMISNPPDGHPHEVSISQLSCTPPSGSSEADAGQDGQDLIEYTPVKNGRRLRARVSSSTAQSNTDLNGKRINGRRKSTKAGGVGGDLANMDLESGVFRTATSKGDIRRQIAVDTKPRRDAFLMEKKDLWLPLLPPQNYIARLLEKQTATERSDDAPDSDRQSRPDSDHDMRRSDPSSSTLHPESANTGYDTIANPSDPNVSSEPKPRTTSATQPYVEFEEQPKGVRAIMKPYQLSGLSFMVYLQRNGLGGILGDEMGLGKTLQTLSLIQHLKETGTETGKGRLQRPCLVICPLSVLSSWMAEARKWTPGLRVIRFHGPVKERTRQKKIVMGEIDMYGQLTSRGKAKLQAHGKSKAGTVEKHASDDESIGVDVVVTTYDSFKAENEWFKRAFVWRYCILDEGHTIKNHVSLISKSLQTLRAEYRLILTGTPLQNNLSELWSLLHWLYPDVFTLKTNELFDTSFNLSKGHFSTTVVDDARRLLELIMLRRMKNSPGVELGLPPKTEVVMYVPLSPMQLFWYKRMITKADSGLLNELFQNSGDKELQAKRDESLADSGAVEQAIALHEKHSQGAVVEAQAWQETQAILERTMQRETDAQGDTKTASQWRNLMNLVMRLRQVSNHPYQIRGAEPDPYYSGEHVITASGKFIVLEKIIQQLVITEKKKILIFSGFTNMLDLVEELLYLRGGNGTQFRFARIDGSTCRARRNLSIRMVNDSSSDYRVMLISTRAGGLGINLASASDIVLLDQDWNPQITLQAESRAHRIGQKNPVTVYKLVSQGTVEEQMMGRIQKKLYLSAKVTEAMSDIHTRFGKKRQTTKSKSQAKDDDMPEMSISQLMTMIRRGASAISRPAIDLKEMSAWDWAMTVSKCRDQPADLTVKGEPSSTAEMDGDAERAWLTEMERVEASVFEGHRLVKADKSSKSNKDIASEWFTSGLGSRADRRIGKNVTVMVDGYAVSKDTLDCAPWEAVKTLAGTDPRLAEPVRAKKAEVNNQSHCQKCFDGGEIVLCQLCPRSYHVACLDAEYQTKAQKWQFVCPQHECYDCAQKTTEAGGMLFRCRWCERAYCEDCFDFDHSQLLSETLDEYVHLDFPEAAQAFYVVCAGCTTEAAGDNEQRKFRASWEAVWRADREEKFGTRDDVSAGSRTSRAGSMTDATTIETSGPATPAMCDADVTSGKTGTKRKLKLRLGTDGQKKVKVHA